jgi:hypothetical protein
MAESSTPFYGRWLRARCRRRSHRLGAVLAAGLLAVSVCPAEAQTAQGQLLDVETGEPVEGALVLLLDEGGGEAGGYLTNNAGRFLIQAPAPGTYTLRAERIGYETTSSEPFQLRQAERFGIRLEAKKTAIQLEGIQVEGDQRCLVRPGEGLQVASVWDEARKALTVQDWTEREGSFRFQMLRHQRELDWPTEAILSETRDITSGVSQSPIRSLPADDLLTKGFIRQSERGGYDYFGPDASVLLSDLFLDTHCFSLRSDPDRPNEIGLSFEPVNRGRLPDITGTLWLDSETAQLRVLEYDYTWSPWPEAYGVARGQVDFESLPTGAWIVRRWWIRMPMVAADFTQTRSRGTSRIRVVGLKEVGGEITQYSSLDRTVVSEAIPKGVLEGQVWDTPRQAPLEGATVFLSGTSYAAETDREGRFVIPDLPEGTFLATFTHPRLDSLGVFAQPVQVTISLDIAATVTLRIPSTGPDPGGSCNVNELEEGTWFLVGFVREAGTDTPLAGATVLMDWSTFEGEEIIRLVERRRQLQVTSDSQGRFTGCGIPVDTRLTIRAVLNEEESEPVVVTAQEGEATVVNLVIGG